MYESSRRSSDMTILTKQRVLMEHPDKSLTKMRVATVIVESDSRGHLKDGRPVVRLERGTWVYRPR